MNITISTQALASELKVLSKIAAAKPTIPITGHALLQAQDGCLMISTTDLEIALCSECDAEVIEAGETTLPAKMLLDVLEQLPSGEININKGRLSTGTYRSRLQSLPPQDFPPMPPVTGETAVLSVRALRALIDRTRYAISDKAQQYATTGALLSLAGEVMAMVATDTKRISIATASRVPGADYNVVIPGKTLDALMAQPPSGDVIFSRSDRHLFFQFEKRLLISRALEGEFPRYQKAIPKENNHILSVNRAMLMATLRRIGLVSDAVNMQATSDKLEIFATSTEVGDAHEELQVAYEGPPIRLCVNWKYLFEFLEKGAESTAVIRMKDGKSPLLMTDGLDFINVVMTIRVDK